MVTWQQKAKSWSCRVFGLAVLASLLLGCVTRDAWAGVFTKHRKANAAPQKSGVTASQPAAFSIPVEPLGFYAPGAFYQGQRQSLVSLDFLDENRLLFTFRAPGLMHRAAPESDIRQIRAVVLALPQGSIESESLWTLRDRDRYVWMLNNGHFLLRDGDQLKEGDATLDLKPLLQFPGPLLWVDLDPAEQYMVTNSLEAVAKPKPTQVDSPATAEASVTTDDSKTGTPDIVLRILKRATGQVMLVSRVRSTVHIPINSEGYVETLRSTGRSWVFNLDFFTGGSKILGKVDSACEPPVQFVSHELAVINTCVPQGGRNLVALTTQGHRNWDAPSPPTQVWPLLVPSPDGSRIARESLTVTHPVDAFSPLSFEDVTGQLVEVFDSTGGKLALKAPASPVFDGGGNLAISPSGKRVAVLDAGAIQVYELPTPVAPSSSSGNSKP